jgi:dTDP-4-amino-4,6-dideoxygalactose transaminase
MSSPATSRSFIPLASPDIRPVDIEAMVRVVQSGMLVQGSEVARFEAAICNYLGTRHAICVSNGTATMHLALLAMGIGPGDEIIVPAFSYVATANVVEVVGATSVFVDIERDTFNIDISQIESKITPRTKAILPVHEFGLCCNIHEIKTIAAANNLMVIEDAACALGATDRGAMAGTVGHLGSFSLHPRKAITSGEGGIVSTDNDELADKILALRNHGIRSGSNPMDFVEAGLNCRMTDFQAALVHSQFQRLPEILKYKQLLADIYFEEIKHPRVTLPVVPENKFHTWQSFHVVLTEDFDRNQAIVKLREQGIGTNYGAQCIPAQTWYQKKYGLDSQKLFPNAWRAFSQGLVLPLYEKLTPDDIKFIAEKTNQL